MKIFFDIHLIGFTLQIVLMKLQMQLGFENLDQGNVKELLKSNSEELDENNPIMDLQTTYEEFNETPITSLKKEITQKNFI